MSNKIIKAGKLFSFESGEYSDHTVHGMFVALHDIDPVALAYELPTDDNDWDYTKRLDRTFLPHLLSKGLAVEVPYSEIWVDDYGHNMIRVSGEGVE